MVNLSDAPSPTVSSVPSTIPAEQRLTLHRVSWDTYEALLNLFGEHRALRMYYSDEVLEFMVPLEAHENASDLIGDFIKALTIESGLTIKSMASTTLKRSTLQKGAEPDKGFYIQNEPLVRGKLVDLERDPPPDLVVEVDLTHTDMNKNQLYAELGVPELWRYNGRVLTIYQLQEGEYQSVEFSPTFPWFAKTVLYQFLQQCKTDGEAQALRDLRQWIIAQVPRSV